jgi:membrane associated rhomboid family serine protease
VTFIILLAAFGAFAYYGMSPEQRARCLEIAIDVVRQLKIAATERHPANDAFRELLRARTPYVVITAVIVAINAAVIVCMLSGATAIGDPDTLVAWGASLGPRTTNGEWWRLVTSTFVHTGILHLLVDAAILIQLGAVLERLLGRLAFGAVYVFAGAFAGLTNLSSRPVAASVGASSAVFGLYGLLIASLIWQMFRLYKDDRPDAEQLHHDDQADAEQIHNGDQPDAEQTTPPRVMIPLIVIKRLGYGAVLFIVYSGLNGFAGAPEFAGLIVGLGYGLVLGRRAVDAQPGPRHVAAAIAASGVIAIACALPLRNIADVKPEIARVIATEERTAAAYQSALPAFKKGRITAEALADLAERTIMPALQAVDARLAALSHVPAEHQGLVNDAREYVRLRCQSWRLRADAIRRTNTAPRRSSDGAAGAPGRLQAEARFRSNMAVMGNAENAERASLVAFQRIKR